MQTDCPARAKDRAGVFNAKVFLAEVDAIGTNCGGDISPIVDDEYCTSSAGGLAEKRSAIDEIAIVKVFVAKLDHADTGGNERRAIDWPDARAGTLCIVPARSSAPIPNAIARSS